MRTGISNAILVSVLLVAPAHVVGGPSKTTTGDATATTSADQGAIERQKSLTALELGLLSSCRALNSAIKAEASNVWQTAHFPPNDPQRGRFLHAAEASLLLLRVAITYALVTGHHSDLAAGLLADDKATTSELLKKAMELDAAIRRSLAEIGQETK